MFGDLTGTVPLECEVVSCSRHSSQMFTMSELNAGYCSVTCGVMCQF